MGLNIQSGDSSDLASVDANKRLKVALETNAGANPSQVAAIRIFSENDPGAVTGTPYLLSPETTDDAKLRLTGERPLDTETFNYTAQSTGKHTYSNTTLAFAWTTGGLQTNSGSITTTTTGATFGTYAEFPAAVGAHNVYCEVEAQVSAVVPSNTIIDFGLFRRGASNPYAPTDGAYFRVTSSGVFGVANFGGVETVTPAFSGFTPSPGVKYQFIITLNEREVQFWINGVEQAEIAVPTGQGQPFQGSTLPFSVRHAIVGGAASSVVQFLVVDYTISQDNPSTAYTGSQLGNLLYGSYQGLSGGTMGGLALWTNNTNPTAAVATNTTAALGSGLGGQVWETDTLAVNTDGILYSYQVPAGSVSVQGRRLLIYGVKLDTFIQTTLVGGGYNEQLALAFGHTAVSLATAEAAATKKPRIVYLGSRTVASAAAALTQLATIQMTFSQPVVVNPGEFVAITTKKIGTAPTGGVRAHAAALDYGWE